MNKMAVLALSFIVAIVMAQFLSAPIIACVFVMLAILARFLNLRSARMMTTIGIASVLAATAVLISPSPLPEALYSRPLLTNGRVIDVSDDSFDMRIMGINGRKVWPGYNVRVYDNNVAIQIGCQIDANVVLQEPSSRSNPGQFDFARYLRQRSIYAVTYSIDDIRVKESGLLSAAISDLRRSVIDRAVTLFSDDLEGIFLALVLGDKGELDHSVRNDFQAAGLSHLLVVSGLHVGIIALAVLWLCVRVFRLRMRISSWVTVACLASYMLLVGATVSVMRAVIMISLILLARAYYRLSNPLTTLSFSAVVILFMNPTLIHNIGFQLSFAATVGVLWLARALSETFGSSSRASTLTITLAVQLMTLPLLINSFNYISLYAILANMLLVPIGTIALVGGILCLLPGVSLFCVYPERFLLTVFNVGAKFFADLPFAQYSASAWPVWLIIVYYLMMLILINMKSINIRRSLTVAVTAVALLAVVFTSSFNAKLFEITFLDVGEGDSIVLHWPTGETIIVDTGVCNMGKNVVLPFLRQAGVNRLNAAVITHGHSDHFGGFMEICDKIETEKIFVSPFFFDCNDSEQQSLIEKLQQMKNTVFTAVDEDTINIGRGTYVQILNPPCSGVLGCCDENNHSIVMKVVYGGVSFLLTGDIEKEAEINMLLRHSDILQCDVIKVPHHGSATSSTNDFVSCVNPEYAVISVGPNYYGHPDSSVIDRYERLDAKVLRTDMNGAITIATDGRRIVVDTFR